MTRGEAAKNNFMRGYNCSQAVVLAFCEDLGIESKTALMLASPFGGGMGRQGEVCGTVTGMYMVLGLRRGSFDCENSAEKRRIYSEVRELSEKFKADNASILCRELLAGRAKAKSGTPSDLCTGKALSCAELCEYAADLLDEYLKTAENT